MKVSISLSPEDLEFLDRYTQTQGFDSRSAVVRKAVTLLRSEGLGAAYEEAWQQWDTSGEGPVWDAAVADGLER